MAEREPGILCDFCLGEEPEFVLISDRVDNDDYFGWVGKDGSDILWCVCPMCAVAVTALGFFSGEAPKGAEAIFVERVVRSWTGSGQAPPNNLHTLAKLTILHLQKHRPRIQEFAEEGLRDVAEDEWEKRINSLWKKLVEMDLLKQEI